MDRLDAAAANKLPPSLNPATTEKSDAAMMTAMNPVSCVSRLL